MSKRRYNIDGLQRITDEEYIKEFNNLSNDIHNILLNKAKNNNLCPILCLSVLCEIVCNILITQTTDQEINNILCNLRGLNNSLESLIKIKFYEYKNINNITIH